MSTLRPNATLEQAAAYLDSYSRKVNREFRKHGGWASRIRGSVYACHDEALSKAALVKNPQVRVYVIMGVIEEIARGGMMADCGFESDGLFTGLKVALMDLAGKVQEGHIASPTAWLQKNVYGPIQSGQLSYVTGDGMINFAGESLGDWDAMTKEVKAAFEKKLSDKELAEAAKRDAAKQVIEADNDAEAARKELEDAKKKVQAAERKVAKAETGAAKARETVQILESRTVRKSACTAAAERSKRQKKSK